MIFSMLAVFFKIRQYLEKFLKNNSLQPLPISVKSKQ